MTIPPSPPPYGVYPPPGPGYPPPVRTNGLAIASLICAFLFFPLGIVFGHVSLSQIRKRHEDGRGLAIAGLVLSYVAALLTVVAVLLLVVFAAAMVRIAEDFERTHPSAGLPGVASAPAQPLPPFKPSAALGSNCQYPATTESASKPVRPPRTGRVPLTPATVDATVTTNLGAVGLRLDNGRSPCTVNNFVSLAQQGFYDESPCHRLTTSPSLHVLQCGDPTGSGTGGPGYRFPNEYPTDQYRLADPGLKAPVVYPRGTLAMANTGQGTNGSQFFVVYQDSEMPPTYTVFGTVDATGLRVVDAIAAGGVKDGSEDGRPATAVTIQDVRLD
ncbi:peptidylprolyl isomerase [Mycolicibacterium sp. 050158]|uniref:peptidylprolyl isomerase n=1 Tax=Mycolicibacterium sp. 050158 TaxID=3090602 RepID=UPI00299EF57A|nr:peptidylprolyl isomerase [Mycolicibacterium sp. 050158]MDX1890865.1 peptidylprolyl isomerase [Mycolicibacterium sp. 050158]